MADLDTLRPEVAEAMDAVTAHFVYTSESDDAEAWRRCRAELVRMADENVRQNKIESLATEQRLQMEEVELSLMAVSQPDDEDADWCDRMQSAIELLVQDCNEAVGQKNKAEAELAALKTRIAEAPLEVVESLPGAVGPPWPMDHWIEVRMADPCACVGQGLIGKRVRLLVEE